MQLYDPLGIDVVLIRTVTFTESEDELFPTPSDSESLLDEFTVFARGGSIFYDSIMLIT